MPQDNETVPHELKDIQCEGQPNLLDVGFRSDKQAAGFAESRADKTPGQQTYAKTGQELIDVSLDILE